MPDERAGHGSPGQHPTRMDGTWIDDACRLALLQHTRGWESALLGPQGWIEQSLHSRPSRLAGGGHEQKDEGEEAQKSSGGMETSTDRWREGEDRSGLCALEPHRRKGNHGVSAPETRYFLGNSNCLWLTCSNTVAARRTGGFDSELSMPPKICLLSRPGPTAPCTAHRSHVWPAGILPAPFPRN